MSVFHSWPFLHLHHTFLFAKGATWEGSNGRFLSDHSSASSGNIVFRSLKPGRIILWEQYGHPAPLTLLLTEASHSCPHLPFQKTFLCVPGPIIVGSKGLFFVDHSFDNSGSIVLRSLTPGIILAFEHIGHFSPHDLAFALVCHSCPHEPFHQYSLFEP